MDGLNDLAGYDVWGGGGTGGGEEQCALLLGLRGVSGVAGSLMQGLEGDLAPLGANSSGLDDNDVDAKGFEFHTETVAEAFHSELGCVIPSPERFPSLTANRRDIQYLS
jgi:hypothetical protein